MQEELSSTEMTIKEAIHRLEATNNFNAVDPGTIAAIISIGKFIYDSLQKDEPDNGQDEWLDEINSNLEKISSQLVQIADAISMLNVKLDMKFRELAEIQVIGRVQSIQILNISWRSNNDERLNSAEVQLEIANELATFLGVTRELMQYGYAHYDTIALAMRLELYLLVISNRHSSDSFKASLKHYLRYFQEAIDPNVLGSLAHSLNTTEGVMNNYRNRYKEGNIIQYARRQGSRVPDGNRICKTKIRKYIRVAGHVESGFTFPKAPELTTVTKYDCAREPDGRDHNHKMFVERIEMTHMSKTDPEVIAHMNAHVRYTKELLPTKHTLEVSIEQVTQYIENVRTNLG